MLVRQFTKNTPVTQIAMPTSPNSSSLSSNHNHAINAVTGGVRYMKLTTRVAAEWRIMKYSSQTAPNESASTSHASANRNYGVQCTTRVSKIKAAMMKSVPAVTYCTHSAGRQSIPPPNRF